MTTQRHIAVQVRPAAPAVLGYVAVRMVGLVALWGAGGYSWPAFWGSLTEQYDADWLLAVASSGYDDGRDAPSNLAFFPLYPALVRGVGAVVGIPAGGLVVSWGAGLACAVAFYAIGRRMGNPAMGTAMAVLWGVLPHAVTQSMAYTETVFTALAAWTLFALLGRQWILAGALTALAGLARPTAAALIVVTGTAMIVQLVRTRGRDWRAWIAGLMAPLGMLGYIVWVSARTGGLDGYLAIQAGWGSSFDAGRYTARTFLVLLDGDAPLQYLMVSAVIVASVTLAAISASERVRWELQLYGLLVIILALGVAGYYQSKARLLMPAFTLLIPVATWVSRMRPTTRFLVLSVLTLISAWYGTYLLIHAPYSP